MVEEMVEGYEYALTDMVKDAGPEPDVVKVVKRRALGRRWRHRADERIGGTEPVIPLGKKFWPLDAEERSRLKRLFEGADLQSQILTLDPRDEDRNVELLDAAYWMKGCSSLGLLRYAVLLRIKGAKRRDVFALIDLKQAIAPAAPSTDVDAMPADPAQRVEAGARALSPNLGDRMMLPGLATISCSCGNWQRRI